MATISETCPINSLKGGLEKEYEVVTLAMCFKWFQHHHIYCCLVVSKGWHQASNELFRPLPSIYYAEWSDKLKLSKSRLVPFKLQAGNDILPFFSIQCPSPLHANEHIGGMVKHRPFPDLPSYCGGGGVHMGRIPKWACSPKWNNSATISLWVMHR